MPHTLEWKVRLYLFEGEGATKARRVLDTGARKLSGHGVAHRNPADMDVPEIGDELAAGRAMHDLAQQLVDAAARDIEDMGASGPGSTRSLDGPCDRRGRSKLDNPAGVRHRLGNPPGEQRVPLQSQARCRSRSEGG